MINEIEKNFKDIQASIINKFEKFELSKNLNKVHDAWNRPEGGGGITHIISEGNVFDNCAINFSSIYGERLPESALANSLNVEAKNGYQAMGISVISHPKNTYAEIIGQRDCSIQRKNQKIVEEIPSDFVNINNLEIIKKNIKELLLQNKYEGLGTLEFLYQDNEVFFIEMNTRLQVEHPVTEEAYDIDLVKYQIMVGIE